MTQPQLASNPQRPGQMTAVMRAASQASGPRVLRIGLVQGGKVIEERVIKQRSTVTVGPSEKSTFVLPTKSLPPTFKLFELVGAEYVLNFLDGMTGRVALKTGISDLNALRGQAKRVQVGPAQAFQVPLNDEARGKVVIGETTFLFQFVAPPPVQPRPQLPLSVKSGVEIDWNTTIIAAFSFLLHFSLIGSIYADWMDPPVDDELSVAQLIDAVKQLPPPPPVEQPKETVDATATSTAVATAEAAAPSKAVSQGSGAKSTGSGKASNISDARASQISNELASLDVAMISTLSSSGVSTDRVLSSGDIPLAVLDQAAAANAAAGRGNSSGLNLGGNASGSFTPGAGSGNGLANMANSGKNETAASAGTTGPVKGPVGNVAVGGANVSGGSVSNAAAVVSKMAAGFRRCYNKGLQEDPNMKGSVRITAKIGPNGEVLSANPSGGGGLSGTVTSCVAQRVASAQFAPPDGGGATIVIPVSFTSQ
jgi:hypothetical protein